MKKFSFIIFVPEVISVTLHETKESVKLFEGMKIEEIFRGNKTEKLFVKENRRNKVHKAFVKSADDREIEIRHLKPKFRLHGKKGFLYKILGRFQKENLSVSHFLFLCGLLYKLTQTNAVNMYVKLVLTSIVLGPIYNLASTS